LCALILLPAFCFSQSYCALYPKECEASKQFFAQHKEEFEQAGGNIGLSAEFLFAIVAPELSQFSYLSNKLETYSLKVMYVQGGKAYSDFSIGFFQMKPSFIENLENYICADTVLRNKYQEFIFDNPDKRETRIERIDRLGNLAWQMKYLSLFCTVVNHKFSTVHFASEEDKLRFYASAYNCGFHKTEQQIRDTAQKPLFPHFSRQKFKYADISNWFYKEILN